MRRQRAGFTIVELLVVIAIIGTLMGLLLPAVQAARESGRRVACRNNVSQIAKAFIQFETSMGFFPSGGWGNLWLPASARSGEIKQPGGWPFAILPGIEQQPLRDMLDRVTAADAAATYAAALGTPLPAFACPSRRSAQPAATRGQMFRTAFSTVSAPAAARTDYAANGGSGAACPPLYVLRGVSSTMKPPFCHEPAGAKTTISNLDVTSILIGGHVRDLDDHLGGCDTCNRLVADESDNPADLADGDAKATTPLANKLSWHNYMPDFQDGIVYRTSRMVPAKISDGLSNTYLLAEKYVPREGDAGTGLGDDPLLAGFGSHNIRWAFDQPANDRDDDVTGSTNAGRRANAMGSAHNGTFTVAYADGSVQEISTAVDLAVHRRLASRADGQTVERP